MGIRACTSRSVTALVLFVVLAVPLCSSADAPRIEAEWSAEGEVPPITMSSNGTDADRIQAQAVRARMVENVQYWKDHGLPNPPDLKSVVYIPSYRGLKLRDFVTVLNPGFTDLTRHVEEQHAYFLKSRLFQLLVKFDKKMKVRRAKKRGEEGKNEEDGPSFADSVFDRYAQIRYSVKIPDFYRHFSADATLDQIQESKEEALMHDNAFYTRSPQLDLTKVLKLWHPGDEELSLSALMIDLFDNRELKRAMIDKTFFTPRIVIVPRTTQTAGDAAVSTLWDPTVTLHELGHHLGHSLAGHRGKDENLDRIVDEVFADYLAASPTDDPEIGAFFAKASAIVAQRLENGEKDPASLYLAYKLKKLSERGLLRSLRAKSDLDQLPRHYHTADDYTSGNPLRHLVWELRNVPGVDRADVERVYVDTLIEFGELPMLIAPKTNLVLGLRSLWQGLIETARISREEKKLARELRVDVAKLDATAKQSLGFEAKKRYGQKLKQWEDRKLAWNQLMQKLGMGERPGIKADYVLPEFLRVLYRVAARRSPELMDPIREIGSRILGSHSVVIDTSNGPELIFPRSIRNIWNPIERVYLAWLGRSTAAKREALIAANREWKTLTDAEDFDAESDEAKNHPLAATLKKRRSTYARRIDQRANYERTGNPIRLVVAHPVMDPIHLGLGVAFGCLKALARVASLAGTKK